MALLVHLAVLRDYLEHNPAARTPIGDGGVYWRMAGRIAAGQWLDDKPFFAAPLYPYLLGLVRATGGGLVTVYVLQMFAHLVTALLIARIARLRFGEKVALSSAILFLCLGEPIFGSLRVLQGTLVLLLAAALWAQLLRVRDKPSVWGQVGAGALGGLLCLAFPPMQLLLLSGAAWVWLAAGRGARAWACAATFLLSATVLIAPATLHNYRACGEFIPITAHGGVAFRLGYGPQGRGVYTPIPGFSRTSEQQPEDAAAYYRRETGRQGTPPEIDRFFYARGWAEIRRNPVGALGLALRKAYWFFTGRYYHDIFQADFEIRRGFGSKALLVLLPTAWLMLPALVGLAVMLRQPVRNGPDWMFFAVPLVVTMVFWYSPRYRAPAIPFVVIACTWVFARALATRRWAWMSAAAASLAGGFILGAMNRTIGFDHPQAQQTELEFNLGLVFLRQGRGAEAVDSFGRVLAEEPNHVAALSKLAGVLAGQGALDQAEELCVRALGIDPTDAEAHATLGSIYSETARFTEADHHFAQALEAAPACAETYYNLGVHLLRRGRADQARTRFEQCLARDPEHFKALNNLGNLLASSGRAEQAMAYYRRALSVQSDSAELHNNLAGALVELGRTEQAIEHYESAIRLAPTYARARENLGLLLLGIGRAPEAVQHLGEAVRLAPDRPESALDLAWLLATHPDQTVRDGPRAVQLARQACHLLDKEEPAALDILAAAQAETGDFAAAVQSATRSLELAEQQNRSNQAEAARRRLELYKAGRPYREPR